MPGETVPAHERAAAQAVGADKPEDIAQGVGTAQGHPVDVAPMRISPAFDEHHPPRLELVDDCVHCGFCLPTCPTYALWGEEMDSPRGRIYLMREGIEGEPLDDAMAAHIDRCLGCLACVTACPSGVQYGKLIGDTRQQIERRYPRSFGERFYRELIFKVFPYRTRLRLLTAPLALYQRTGAQRRLRRSGLPARLPEHLAMLESLTPEVALRRPAIPEYTPAAGRERRRVGLLLGCVQEAFFSQVNAATVRVLAAEGCSVVAPIAQACCGALSEHAGREQEALAFARRAIDVFEASRVDTVVVNAAGCGTAMKEYSYLLRDDPEYAERAERLAGRVRDITELLCELEPVAERHPLPLTAVYHDACHLAHGQGITAQPRQLLRVIPGFELREVPREREICCGSAGTYNLFQPDAARDLGARKAASVLDADAQLLVTANPGCHLQIQAAVRRMGRDLPAAHVVEVLDASIRGAPSDSLLS